jgi:ComF family protein
MQSPLVYQAATRHFIHQFKFNGQLHIANALLTHLYPCYEHQAIEALIPVPLHKTRLIERGYNQSTEIAQVLSRLLHIPLDQHSLKRIRATQPQSGLSLNKRQKNVTKAFHYQPLHAYKSVAIVDDVITTGSTMSEISRLLLKSGVQHIQAWSLARALKHE